MMSFILFTVPCRMAPITASKRLTLRSPSWSTHQVYKIQATAIKIWAHILQTSYGNLRRISGFMTIFDNIRENTNQTLFRSTY